MIIGFFEMETALDLVMYDTNILMHDDPQSDLIKFHNKCLQLYNSVNHIDIFDEITFEGYDKILRHIAHLVVEAIPELYGFEIPDAKKPEIKEFRDWLSLVQYNEFILLLYFAIERGLLNIKNDEDLQFIINSYFTNMGFK